MNKPNNMQAHFQSFNSALQTEVQRIEAMQKEVESREKALNDEKERMMKIEVEDDDVVSLNIGGKIMAASRSTLCQVEGSLLASMFSGRWEERLKKDKHGNVFLDFNPDCFKLILNYLRAKKIENPRSKAKEPKPPEDETSNYWNLVDYLGLRDELQSENSKNTEGEEFQEEGEELQISCEDYYDGEKQVVYKQREWNTTRRCHSGFGPPSRFGPPGPNLLVDMDPRVQIS